MSSPNRSLLSQLSTIVTVDIDSMDPAAALRHESGTFADMTSNQAIVYAQAIKPENEGLVREAVEYVRASNSGAPAEPAKYLREVVDVVTVRLAKLVYPHLKGKVHAQTSPVFAYDTAQTILHARRLVALFEEHGIPRSRVCIKIPATPESILACRALSSPEEGSAEQPIHTLATCVFSVAQARAAVQASCTYVAPYFNELRVHFEPSLWKEYEQPATQHPMSPVISAMIEALKGSKTLVMPASIVTVPEVLGLASLRPDHLTISAPLLDKLAALPAVPESQLAPVIHESSKDDASDIDYLATEAVHLKEAFMCEPDISRRLVDALTLFGECERRAMEFVRSGAIGVAWDGVSGW
ncbi:putative transaldolase/Fructose-6-phosphate aldolase [Lyophyllum shimeji]|uniref:Transaldolase/Fructose-6-phosphate aldolase n=1 Tax=Lyophyllum shimeji TaxID=47721 RepID=A0A9P3PNV5_LYOSH|nr:putative transaldolase/Fructose-6-phosphate aldolase [Lyophyllum shimeji]